MISLLQERNYRFADTWEIERTDGEILRLTNHDHPLVIGGETFSAVAGISASARQLREDLQQNNQEFKGLLTSTLFTHDDLRAGRYDGAMVSHKLVDWQYPWAGHFLFNLYWIARVTSLGNDSWSAEVEGVSSRLQRAAGRLYVRQCDAVLGDARCQFSPVASYNGSVVNGIVAQQTFNTDLTVAANELNYGRLTWTSGLNNGLTFDVHKNFLTDGKIILTRPTPFAIVIGDDFTVFEGCDGRKETCKDRFSNLVNFRGFPWIAGTMRALRPKA
jgi:uncharacterized phage protein (TIGR02218 family)